MRLTLLLPLVALLSAAPASAGGDASRAREIVAAKIAATATRFVSPAHERAERGAIAAYGPFRVIDERTAALVGITDARSPAALRTMLRDHPGIATLELVECPGTHDDRANLALGRMIRAAGLAVHVPEGGSVRSGAVELAVAGASLRIDDGAEFAVHAWLDEYGRDAHDYAPEAHAHAKYLAYYREMGMAPGEAAAFYAMTNSVPFEDALWLTGAEMRRWLGSAPALPRLAYLDLALSLN